MVATGKYILVMMAKNVFIDCSKLNLMLCHIKLTSCNLPLYIQILLYYSDSSQSLYCTC